MADPLSVAGLAAGVVSLGLQVASGITSYLDAIKGRQEEVASVKRELDGITSTLQRLDSVCSQTEAQQPASVTMKQCIEACLAELDSLSDTSASVKFIDSYHSPSGSAQDMGTNLSRKLRETQHQLAYPIKHRPKLHKLANQLQKLRESLQVSLQEATFCLSLSTAYSMAKMQTDTLLIRAETQAATFSTRSVQDALPGLKSDIANIHPMVQGILQLHHDSQDRQLQAFLAQMKELVQDTTVERSLLSRSTTHQQLKLPKSILGRQTIRPDSLSPLARAVQLYTSLEICDCPVQKSRRYTQYRWASTTFFTQTEPAIHHLPGCKFSLQPPRNDGSRTYGISFTGFRQTISKALQLSISVNYRAGITSIEPMIKYHTVVDRTRAPAFRLVSLIDKWVELMGHVYTRKEAFISPNQYKHDLNRLLHHCFSGILMTFHQKNGSPTDVDHLHQSLAHRLTTVMNNMGCFGIRYNYLKERELGLLGCNQSLLFDYDQLLHNFLDFLPALKTSLITYDVDGRTPLSEILEYPSNTGVQLIVDTLASEENEVLPFLHFQDWRASVGISHKTMAWRLANIPVLAEACDVNPLCEAAYLGDEQKVAYLLSHNPSYIKDEIIALGKTAIHMAVGQPQCLRILVQYATPHILDKEDVNGESALELAFSICRHTNCQSPSTATTKPACPCAKSVEILLEAGCMHEFRSLSFPEDYASDAVVAYANNLVSERNQLKQIARLYIPKSRHEDFGLNSFAVLDANAFRVVKTLQEMGIYIDPRLYRSTINQNVGSIFHRISTPEVADLFYSLGFRDLSACTDSVFPPYIMRQHCMPYVCWFYQHGINLFEPLDSQLKKAPKDPRGVPIRDLAPSSTAAHCIAYEVGKWVFNIQIPSPEEFSAAKSLTPVALADFRDGCLCECSENGCTPFIAMLKSIFISPKFEDSELHIKCLVTKQRELLDFLKGKLTLDALVSAIRYLTYEAMGLPHTCCFLRQGDISRQYFTVRCHSTEIQEIQSENFDEIERFHQIIESLTEELKSVLAGKIEVDFDTAKNYFETTWTERMKLEFEYACEEDIEELVERTRELGVVWQGPLPSDSVFDEETSLPTTQQITSLEFWTDEADRIMRGEKTISGV